MAETAKPEEVEIDLETLRKRRVRIRIGSLVVIIGVVIWGHGWMRTHFDRYLVTEAEAQTRNEVTSQQLRVAVETANRAAEAAEKVGNSLNAYIANEKLASARRTREERVQKLSEVQLWEASNSPNEITRDRKRELAAQISSIEAYIRCLESGRQDCAQ